MPDDRFIHRRLGHSEKVNALSDFEFRVWAQYVLSSDDFGVMRFTAATLQADNDALGAKNMKAVQRALERLAILGLIRTFVHQSRTYCYQHDWQDYQKVEYPRATLHPKPPTDGMTETTAKLFARFPGGWGRKEKDKLPSVDRLENVPQTDPEPFGEHSGEIPREPLAVSRKPVAVSREPAPFPSARTTAGVMAGTLPRDHLNCRQPCIRVCISEKQHAILRARHGGTDADMDAFYADVRAHLDGPVGQRPWQFWDDQFAAKFAGTVDRRTAGNEAAKARFVAGGAK